MSEGSQPSRIETVLYDADGNRTEDESLAVRGEVVELDEAGRVLARRPHKGSTGRSTRSRSTATKASSRPARAVRSVDIA
jgi:hypothetical protein